jgi:hypothetical protein
MHISSKHTCAVGARESPGEHRGSKTHAGSRVCESSGFTGDHMANDESILGSPIVQGKWVHIITRGGISSWISVYD